MTTNSLVSFHYFHKTWQQLVRLQIHMQYNEKKQINILIGSIKDVSLLIKMHDHALCLLQITIQTHFKIYHKNS